jgi:molybdopterin molybdotransferase
VLAHVHPLPNETLRLEDALGRTLATDVGSTDDVPGFDNSAMDGFAIRSEDTKGAGENAPVRLRITGESRAGAPAAVRLGAGEAIRISTGAAVPDGADAVVRIEDCRDLGDAIELRSAVQAGKELRRVGEDIRAGELVLKRGTVIGAAEIGVLATVGAASVECARRAEVTVLATGDELVEPGPALKHGQIRNSNAYSVPAQVASAGGRVRAVAVVRDDHDATVDAIADALQGDVVVVCGGVSVGPHDHVKPALEQLGVEELFWGVALRPGHPTWFGKKDSTLVFGLPGNPVSAMVTFHLFVRPALAALAGREDATLRGTAVMDEPYSKQPGRAHVVRCSLETRDDGLHVRPTKAQGSHILTSMLGAEALAMLEVDRGDVAAGERVEIEILSAGV